MSWHITLLGGLQLFHNHQELKAFQHRKVGVLLAYLAYYQDRRHERDDLVRLLWPDGALDAGRNSLNVALSRLRKHLDDPRLLGSDRYQVWLSTEHLSTDVAKLQVALKQARLLVAEPPRQTTALEAALALFTGSLLPGFNEPWVTVERQYLTEEHLRLLEQLAQRRADDRAWDKAIEYARRALLLDPYREASHQLLLRLYRDSGQPQLARSHYDDLLKRFQEELHTLPSPETRALVPRRRPEQVPEEPEVLFSSNLQIELSQFFGRETECAQLKELLIGGSRLVTLLGTGGVGKTRLALETVRHVEQEQKQVFWAPLAEVGPESRLFEVILGVLRRSGVAPMPHPATPGTDPVEEELVAVLRKTSSILVLDNLEHLPEAEVHRVIRSLLARIPRLTILGTSRRRLGITGEQVYHVLPLETPEKGTRLDAALQIPSVRLLQDRVRLLKPGYSLATEPLDAVLALCARLEGLPLAIEMAAARVAQMPLPTVLAKIEQSLSILVSSNTDVPERHRSLHATLLWSYNLLTPDLQEFLTKLAIFRGGWSLEAAEYVCERPDALDALQTLCDASLIHVRETRDYAGKVSVRYEILEFVKVYLLDNESEKYYIIVYVRFSQWVMIYGKNLKYIDGYFVFIDNYIEILQCSLMYMINRGIYIDLCIDLCRDIKMYFAYSLNFKLGCDVFNALISRCMEIYDLEELRCRYDVFDLLQELAILAYSIGRKDVLEYIRNVVDVLYCRSGVNYSNFNVGRIYMCESIFDGDLEKAIEYAMIVYDESNVLVNNVFVNCNAFYLRLGRCLDVYYRTLDVDFEQFSALGYVCMAQRSQSLLLMGDYCAAEMLCETSCVYFRRANLIRGINYANYVMACINVCNQDWVNASELIRRSAKGFAETMEWGQVGFSIELLAEIAFGIGNSRRGLRLMASCENLWLRASWKSTMYEKSKWNRLLSQIEAAAGLTIDVDRVVVRQQSLETLLYEAFELPDDSPVLA